MPRKDTVLQALYSKAGLAPKLIAYLEAYRAKFPTDRSEGNIVGDCLSASLSSANIWQGALNAKLVKAGLPYMGVIAALVKVQDCIATALSEAKDQQAAQQAFKRWQLQQSQLQQSKDVLKLLLAYNDLFAKLMPVGFSAELANALEGLDRATAVSVNTGALKSRQFVDDRIVLSSQASTASLRSLSSHSSDDTVDNGEAFDDTASVEEYSVLPLSSSMRAYKPAQQAYVESPRRQTVELKAKAIAPVPLPEVPVALPITPEDDPKKLGDAMTQLAQMQMALMKAQTEQTLAQTKLIEAQTAHLLAQSATNKQPAAAPDFSQFAALFQAMLPKAGATVAPTPFAASMTAQATVGAASAPTVTESLTPEVLARKEQQKAALPARIKDLHQLYETAEDNSDASAPLILHFDDAGVFHVNVPRLAKIIEVLCPVGKDGRALSLEVKTKVEGLVATLQTTHDVKAFLKALEALLKQHFYYMDVNTFTGGFMGKKMQWQGAHSAQISAYLAMPKTPVVSHAAPCDHGTAHPETSIENQNQLPPDSHQIDGAALHKIGIEKQQVEVVGVN